METLNHGILRFNDECTLKIDFDQETDDMTVTMINDVTGDETIISGGSGGFCVLQLLDTITITEPSRSVNIDMTPYTAYDIVFVQADCTLSTSSWLYMQINATEPKTDGYTYIGQYSVFKYVVCELLRNVKEGATNYNVVIPTTQGQGQMDGRVQQTVNNLFINTYEPSTNILPGGKFLIYGTKYSDM